MILKSEVYVLGQFSSNQFTKGDESSILNLMDNEQLSFSAFKVMCVNCLRTY